jgi:hypothetical protein
MLLQNYNFSFDFLWYFLYYNLPLHAECFMCLCLLLTFTHCNYCVGFQCDDSCESRMGARESQEPQHTEVRSSWGWSWNYWDCSTYWEASSFHTQKSTPCLVLQVCPASLLEILWHIIPPVMWVCVWGRENTIKFKYVKPILRLKSRIWFQYSLHLYTLY